MAFIYEEATLGKFKGGKIRKCAKGDNGMGRGLASAERRARANTQHAPDNLAMMGRVHW